MKHSPAGDVTVSHDILSYKEILFQLELVREVSGLGKRLSEVAMFKMCPH